MTLSVKPIEAQAKVKQQGGHTRWKKGESGNKAGKPKGAKALWNRISNEERVALANETGGLLPLDLFISVCKQEGAPLATRLAAAAQAAPYLHRKMPMAIEGGDPNRPITIVEIAQLKGLKTAELKVLATLLEKLGVPLIEESAGG